MAEAVAALDRPPATPQEIWAILRETAERQRAADERQKAADERFEREKAENAEWWKEAKERVKALDRQFAEMSKKLGKLGNSVGEMVETLIAARLWEKFSAYPYNLNRAYRRLPVFDASGKTLADIDILLVDGEWAMAVEVKTEVDEGNVKYHLKRMDMIREHPPADVVGKKLLGAIAGGIVDPAARELAHESGFFVLELKGEAVDLAPPPEGFVPREW
ncbi:MAG: hypothetical protein FWC64_09440 [Treponema sp.]|nr:hypothetical protein [Treponema sp.]